MTAKSYLSTQRTLHDGAFFPALKAFVPRAQRVALAVALSIATSLPALAQEREAGDQIRLAYAPKAFHFTHDDEYIDWNHIVSVEWLTPRHTVWGADRSMLGLTLFNNSYGQFSQAVHVGQEWDWTEFAGGNVFLALSVGLVHGYKEPHEDKLPLNNALGVGLTVIPSIGWQRNGLGFAASLAGTAITLRVSYSFGL